MACGHADVELVVCFAQGAQLCVAELFATFPFVAGVAVRHQCVVQYRALDF